MALSKSMLPSRVARRHGNVNAKLVALIVESPPRTLHLDPPLSDEGIRNV